ncbi:hypothetical protein [Streptomyces sp. MH13]|uniref:hypothetical protein n=1 Tax=Streptomyces sp. MH13 TaxID=3417651 RepID=UPI003CF039DE
MLADELIPAAVGSRPPWLLRGPAESMGALYAMLARQRGMKPPRVTVIQKETRKTPTLFNKHKKTEFTTTAGTFDAWYFHYSDPEWGTRKLVLVGAGGNSFEPGDSWIVNDDRQIITRQGLSTTRNAIANAAGRLAMQAGPHAYLTHEASPTLSWAVKQLL